MRFEGPCQLLWVQCPKIPANFEHWTHQQDNCVLSQVVVGLVGVMNLIDLNETI